MKNTIPCENIVEWLMLATKDLCESAKLRVSTEIEAHYKESVDAHVAEGVSEEESRKIALAELGDPKVAGKRFQNEHLTVNEVKKLKSALDSARKPLSIVERVFPLLWLALIAAWFSTLDQFILGIIFYLSWSILVRWISKGLVLWLRPQRAIGWLFATETFSLGVSTAILICTFSSFAKPPPTMPGTVIWICISLTLLTSVHSYRIWKKFQRERAHGNDPVAT
jgi:hypothetical protein